MTPANTFTTIKYKLNFAKSSMVRNTETNEIVSRIPPFPKTKPIADQDVDEKILYNFIINKKCDIHYSSKRIYLIKRRRNNKHYTPKN
jgi:hypothetical protein